MGSGCDADVGGITHVDAGLKSSVSVALSSDDLIDTTLEVTVVIQKSDPQTMYHEAFDISFTSDETASPTRAPTQAPTAPVRNFNDDCYCIEIIMLQFLTLLALFYYSLLLHQLPHQPPLQHKCLQIHHQNLHHRFLH